MKIRETDFSRCVAATYDPWDLCIDRLMFMLQKASTCTRALLTRVVRVTCDDDAPKIRDSASEARRLFRSSWPTDAARCETFCNA